MRTRLAIIFLVSFLCGNAQQNKAAQLIVGMIDSIKNVKTVRTNINSIERINNSYLAAASEIKVNVSPRKLYFVNKEKKLEILYVTDEHNNKALVKPHVFPYFTLSLDPRGNIMRKNQHYTVNELGFDFIGRTIALVLSKEKENLIKSLTYVGKHERNGYMCYMVIYETKDFPYFEYVVKRKETVTSIALKLSVHDYMLRTKNNLFNDFGYLKEGSKILVPLMYCKKAVLYLDEKTMLPVSVSIYDDIGLFENYDYTNIKINKPIDEKEFTKNYKDYGF
ncbi:MAG TPA: DUF1571 domain-containing protein [Bacteroidia bacterium]|nr:DUF1571 domain-containing protein [Bacteroidia bacterium]